MRNAVCCLLALLTWAVSTGARAFDEGRSTGPAIDRSATRVYLGNGQTLVIGMPRRLTDHAHVEEALYRPNGREIAYVETQTTGNISTNFLRLLDLRSGKITLLLSSTNPTYSSGSMGTYELAGWSGDGRYLLMTHSQLVKQANGRSAGGSEVTERFDMLHAPYAHLCVPGKGTDNEQLSDFPTPAPSGSLFLQRGSHPTVPGEAAQPTVYLYDPVSNTHRRIVLPENTDVVYWQDGTHLLLNQYATTGYRQMAYDIIADKIVPRVNQVGEIIPSARAFPGVGLSLTTVPIAIPGPNPQSHAEGTSLWLNIRGAKPDRPAACLSESMAEAGGPSSQLAPDGSSAFWAEHGDLYVSTFAVVPATDVEETGFASPG